MIPFLDLKAVNAQYRADLIAAFSRVLDSGWYVLGEEVKAFESEFADYCGATHCVGVGNGLDALTLTLRAWKQLGRLQRGDEVIVPANTYIATWLAASEVGAVPVPVEPDNETFNIDPKRIADAITREGDVVPALMRRMSLDAPPSAWAEAIQAAHRASKAVSPAQALRAVEQSDFDVRRGLDALQALYRADLMKATGSAT